MRQGVPLAERFWLDGYAVERNVFTPDEVRSWRHRALELGSSFRADLLSDDMLRDVVFDPRVVSRAREILGGQPIYFGDSSTMIGGSSIGGFHKDCADRYDGNAPDWRVDRYPTIRFGIYTQDHAGLPGGLDLRRGSHNYADVTTGEWHSADTRVGDLVVWNGRTTHSGPSAIIKAINHRVQPNGLMWRLLGRVPGKRHFLAKHRQQRVALFVTYGIEHPLVDRQIAVMKTRDYGVVLFAASNWSEEVKTIAAERGLLLRKPDLNGIRHTTIDYVQPPY